MELKSLHLLQQLTDGQLLIVLNGIEIEQGSPSLRRGPLLIVLNGIEINTSA